MSSVLKQLLDSAERKKIGKEREKGEREGEIRREREEKQPVFLISQHLSHCSMIAFAIFSPLLHVLRDLHFRLLFYM